jgi:hypothetical protein
MKMNFITTMNAGELDGDSIDQNVFKPKQDATERNQMIAVAAYFRAEKRGFSPNHELADWLDAENEIERYMSSFQD